jgi:hypothetical protein
LLTLIFLDSAAITGSKITTGTTSAVGVLQLTDSATSTSATTAATPAAVKTAKDAADAAATTANAALPKAGGTMTGNLIIDNAKEIRFSEADGDGANYTGLKAQAQSSDIVLTLPAVAPTTGQVLKSGSTATTLEWATDSATDATKLPLAGGTMSGAIAMGTSKITGLGDPTASQDAATKTYTDTADALKLNLSGGALTGNLTLNAQSDVRFADSDSSHYIALQASGTIASSFTLTLPATDAAVSGYVLASDGSGTLSWVDPGSSSSPTFTGDATLTNDGALVGFSNLNATYTGNVKTLTVTVASKTAAHRYYGSGSSSGYKIGGKESPFLTLTPGRTYKFDQADNSNSGHPLRFYLEADKTTAYTTGVTTSGTAGSSGAYTQIVVSDTTPQILHYQCSSHASMGNSVQTNSNIASTAKTLATARTIGGVSFDGSANINLAGVNATGTQDTSGTAAVATAITIADESSDTTCFPLFATAATGDLGAKSGSNLTFNSSSGALTATSFVGALTGNVTGNASGSSGSCTGNAATATALATARAINGVNFDGSAAITVTAAAGTLSGATLASGVTASSLTSLGTLTALNVSNTATSVIAGTSNTNVLSVRNTTGGNGTVGILMSTQNHASGREKAGIFHVETAGSAHYKGDLVFALNSANGSATQVSTADERMRINSAGDVLLNTDQATIGMNTADGSDNKGWSLCGGSDASQTRGSLVGLFGNEHSSSPGVLALRAGNVTGGIIQFSASGAEVGRIDASGRLLLGTTTEGEGGSDDLNIATSGNTGITVRSGTSSNGNLFFSDGTSGADEYRGYVQYNHSSNSLFLGSNAVTALTLDSSQNATFAGTVSDSIGELRQIPSRSVSSVTLATSDVGKAILATSTVTVPNSTFSAGDAVTIINNSGSDITITKSISTMYLASDGSSANRTLATRGMATIWFASGTVAYISGAGLS